MILLLIILLLLVIGGLPTWPYSRSWGYYPSGGLGLILIVLLVLLLMGRFVKTGRQDLARSGDDTLRPKARNKYRSLGFGASHFSPAAFVVALRFQSELSIGQA